MFDSLSIRLKIVLLSGLCLIGVVALIVGMNIYQTNQNDELVSHSSSKMLTASVQDLLQAKAASGVAGAIAGRVRGCRQAAAVVNHRQLQPPVIQHRHMFLSREASAL